MTIDRTHILILNYNGRSLLEECLPTIVEAAEGAGVPCAVSVIDNASTDGSCDLLAQRWPRVGLIRHENLGLASFNDVLATLDEPVVLLLNNDVKLEGGSIPPLLRAFEEHDDALFSAPLCWTFDGREYEGMRTRVRSRFGLVQGMCRVPGSEAAWREADLTAAAGPVLAVDRLRFLEIGGYDPVYFPGRIEDLDLGFRGWMAGYRGYYEPGSVAYHRGLATFGPAFGDAGCDRLAVRNSFLFAWKNLGGPRLARHLLWIPPRLAYWLARGRIDLALALVAAARRWDDVRRRRRSRRDADGTWVDRQEAFFRRFAW
ncbi:N-acetylglucosaminyl-diphospho-decaprenol L-rhamnosyltransferase [Aquisphaera giovannonii]|uniref:N-acetylglucosaminyl-diphospho-decaprenol L-rhamnosyltransferase n=1 Tax=Aquisphaera giovannonii TaxID=406548 RepID=A0A5B9WAX6_9BACT|nr:glycosyltransferase [Aquisphaera giovannonii]QEH37673.1 N-acetylglucosaminyl-diphospho-decaprenol L-rhamnosyltransferase [Aquisphaera giovannonii]